MEPILYIGISQSLFTFLMLRTKEKKHLYDKYLANWMFCIAAQMGILLIRKNFGIIPFIPVIPFLFGPFMYLYVITLITEKQKSEKIHLLHFVPFILFLVISIVFKNDTIFGVQYFFQEENVALRVFIGASLVISIVTYSIIVFIKIKIHEKNLKNFFSYTSEKISLNWLKIIVACFSISFIAVFIIGSFRVFYKLPVNFENYGTLKITYIGLTIFTFVFSYFGIKQPVIFGNTIKNKTFHNNIINTNSTETTSTEKYKRSGLKNKDAAQYFKDLLQIMDTEKPYLNEKLSIQDLSDILGISRHYLTQVINEKLHKNFYTFINEYRLEEVKKKMLSDKYTNYTILGIALESGFNSKSTFNTLFKSYTGMIPSEYRKNI